MNRCTKYNEYSGKDAKHTHTQNNLHTEAMQNKQPFIYSTGREKNPAQKSSTYSLDYTLQQYQSFIY